MIVTKRGTVRDASTMENNMFLPKKSYLAKAKPPRLLKNKERRVADELAITLFNIHLKKSVVVMSPT